MPLSRVRGAAQARAGSEGYGAGVDVLDGAADPSARFRSMRNGELARSASCCRSRFWSSVEMRAYPISMAASPKITEILYK